MAKEVETTTKDLINTEETLQHQVICLAGARNRFTLDFYFVTQSIQIRGGQVQRCPHHSLITHDQALRETGIWQHLDQDACYSARACPAARLDNHHGRMLAAASDGAARRLHSRGR
jgi:hypothetical protein